MRYTARYSWIQLDTARYVRILDTVGYSGSAAKWVKGLRVRVNPGCSGIPRIW